MLLGIHLGLAWGCLAWAGRVSALGCPKGPDGPVPQALLWRQARPPVAVALTWLL